MIPTVSVRRSVLLAWVLIALGCGTQRPSVAVIGMSDVRTRGASTRLTLLVEVHNPTNHPISLSAFDYEFRAETLIYAKGRVVLKRQVLPGSSTVVEVPVPVQDDAKILEWKQSAGDRRVKYQLDGTLIADDGKYEFNWKVEASGELVPIDPSQGRRQVGGSVRDVVTWSLSPGSR